MYLYADCIHPQPHPDGNVNILRTIAVYGEPHRQYVSKRFQTVYFYPLKAHTVTTIKFDIYDDTGMHIGFDAARCSSCCTSERENYKRQCTTHASAIA